jgi:predicted Rossmann fold nucleotide-binding protein DprA/Smf involved in DNA uptake
METRRIERRDSDYPRSLTERLGSAAPVHLYVMGDISIVCDYTVGLIRSIQCPGSVIVKTLDLARSLRDAGVCVVGAFHSPMEREFLDVLLNGEQPVVLCAARGLVGVRMTQKTRRALADGKLVALSPFDDRVRRTTATQAVKRNDIIAALSNTLFVPYAAPGGKTWITVKAAVARGQAVWTFEDNENAPLTRQGVRPVIARNLADMGVFTSKGGRLA